MSELNPQTGWVALMVRTAREYGRDAVPPIRAELLRVDAGMFSGVELAVYHRIVDLISEGVPPGPGELIARDPEITTQVLARLQLSEKTFASLAGATDAVVRYGEGRRVQQALVAASDALKKGDLGLARALMSEGAAEAPSRGLQKHDGFRGLTFNPVGAKRIPTGLPRLDKLLGGGIGIGGRLSMSLWLAGTGVGKSTFAQGVLVPAWLRAGHWVQYFTGEASGEEVMTEIARLAGDVKYAEIEYTARNNVPAINQKMQRSIDAMAALPGRFIPFDQAFTTDSIRLIAQARKAELEEAKRNGEAREDAELIVVVDNLDNAIEGIDPRAREDQIYNQAARRFVLDARQHDYHLALLHQTNGEGEKRNGAPHKQDVAAAKAVVNHAAFMVTFYRPTTDEDLASLDKDAQGNPVPGRRARHWIAARKARGGKVGEIEVTSRADTGLWFDPELSAPAF